MRKIRLDPDALRVDTFATRTDAARGGGTVRAHDSTQPTFAYPNCQKSFDWCTESVSGMHDCICDTGASCDRC